MRRTSSGAVEVLLVTSRETQRWVIPKGWPWKGASDPSSAAGEAREEAGVEGEVERVAFGRYQYGKRRPRDVLDVAVDVYLLWVTQVLEDWPERAERRRRWFDPRDAANAVDEPQLKAMLLALEELPRGRGA